MLLDIVILPPQTLRQKIGKLVTQAVQGVPYTYVVDNKKLIPHVSLFHLRSLKSRIPALSLIVGEVVLHHKIFQMAVKGIRTGSALYFWLTNSAAFMELHREIVRQCHVFKIGAMPWTPKRQPTKQEAYYRRRYGTQHILQLKKPHITLAEIKRKADAKIVFKRLRSVTFRFVVHEVAICEVNWNHQVTRILKRFKVG